MEQLLLQPFDIANIPIKAGLIDNIPGSPPTPIEFAITPPPTEITAAIADPVIPQKNGNPCFKLTPNIAGSVTPR